MNRINELTARSLLARAERHGWKYCGIDRNGYLCKRTHRTTGEELLVLCCRIRMAARFVSFRERKGA